MGGEEKNERRKSEGIGPKDQTMGKQQQISLNRQAVYELKTPELSVCVAESCFLSLVVGDRES